MDWVFWCITVFKQQLDLLYNKKNEKLTFYNIKHLSNVSDNINYWLFISSLL